MVTGVSVGSVFSITSDSGRTFTYTFNSTSTTWGEVANALNASNIGVMADFIPGSVDGWHLQSAFPCHQRQGFHLQRGDRPERDGRSGRPHHPDGQVFNPNNLFANGVAAPAAGRNRLHRELWRHITGSAGAGVTLATVIPAGSSIVFEDGNGQYRTINYGAATTVSQFITDVTALGAGIKAELVNQSGGPVARSSCACAT